MLGQMLRFVGHRLRALSSILLASSVAACAARCPGAKSDASAGGTGSSSAAERTDQPIPRNRDYPWMSRATWWQHHQSLLALDPAVKARARIVFIGDSIVEGWDDASFREHYGEYHGLRFGIGGDMTQQVLFRIEQGELEHLKPRVVVLLIGTNNLANANDTPDEVARGVEAVVRSIRMLMPEATLVLLAILPRDLPGSALRALVSDTNGLLARLGDGEKIRYTDVGSHFLRADGAIPTGFMADALHPTPDGYRVLAKALQPVVTPLMRAGLVEASDGAKQQ